jgi:prefoldin subunit 5
MPVPTDQPIRKAPSLDGLSSTAKTLTEASRRLNTAVEHLNEALKKLNLGITSWAHVSSSDAMHGVSEWEEIGYARHKGTWGICIRQTIEGHAPEPEETIWHFDDAPRDIRIRCAACLNQLVEKLDQTAKETTQEITERVTDTEELAATISEIADAARGKAMLIQKGGR